MMIQSALTAPYTTQSNSPEVRAISVREERSSVGWQATFFTWEMYNGEVSMTSPCNVDLSPAKHPINGWAGLLFIAAVTRADDGAVSDAAQAANIGIGERMTEPSAPPAGYRLYAAAS